MVRTVSFLTVFLFLLMNASFAQLPEGFDIQGHRGCRALYPENSIPACIHALELGVTTLELDVVITKDNHVVLCHDPVLNEKICRIKNCKESAPNRDRRIYHLTYDQLLQFDCGCNGHPDFPEQKKLSVKIPLLSELIDSVEAYISQKGMKKIKYNIEIKSKPEHDNVLTPTVDQFVELVFRIISEKNITDRVIIQSFDLRALQKMRTIDSNIQLALLVSNLKSHEKNIELLGFTPDIYSPYFRLINKKHVDDLHARGIKVIPWTVNDLKKIKKLIKIGVDGIITDDPRLLKKTTYAH